jgi:uncharacterized protein YbjT (DUF2867 family)
MSKDLVLVFGATGNIGSEVMRLLKNEGFRVRGTTSQTIPKGSDLVHVNLATGEGIDAAMDRVDRAFLMSPPGYSDQYSILSPLIQEAKRRNLKKVVLMTSLGANSSDSTPFRRAELELENSGLSYNIVRPNWFYQNFNTFWVSGIHSQGKILLPAGNAQVGFIDTRDVAAVIEKLLTTNQHSKQAFDITGPELVDHHTVANAISSATGKVITYQEIEPETLFSGLISSGVPNEYAEFIIAILGYLRKGCSAVTNGNVEFILKREPIGLGKYANDYRNAWL